MNDYGTLVAPDTIRFQRLLPGPIERVWAHLTEADKRAAWFAGGAMDLRPGGRFEMRFDHANLTPHQETIPDRWKEMENGVTFVTEVTACDPPRLIGYAWSEEQGPKSEVTFELSPQGGQVLLVLTHRRLGREMLFDVAGGWHTHLDVLAARLEGRTPPLFWATAERLEQEYRERLTKALAAGGRAA